jgi:hypothetical protein
MSTSGQPDQLWSKIVDDFREACVLRKNGRHEESNELLQHVLPGEIAAWSRMPMPEGINRRSRLETMFRDEQRRVDDAFFVQRLVTIQIEEHLLPKLCFMVAEEVREAVRNDARTAPAPAARPQPHDRPKTQSPARPRVRFDDIPGMIDSILHDQQSDPGSGLQAA